MHRIAVFSFTWLPPLENFASKQKASFLCHIANIVVLAPPSTITVSYSLPQMPLSNGHTSPLANSALTNDDAPYDSESDLSEVAIPMIDEPSPATPSNHQSEFGGGNTEASESDDKEVPDESEDADFDMDDSPPPAATNSRHERSTSTESRRPPKRKIGVEDDAHILANPELYGLRRSVCIALYRVEFQPC